MSNPILKSSLRGNSASGKTTIAKQLQEYFEKKKSQPQ